MGTADLPEEWQEILSEVKGMLRDEGDYYGGWERFENGSIGHSGGTPNYSSRIVFSDQDGVGACVLTNLNVAASTDSLCNGIFTMLSGGEMGKIQSDVWTIFDRIFTGLFLMEFALLPVCIRSRKRGMLIVTGIVSVVIMTTLAITLPLIFGAGLFAILFTWAPLSLASFFGMMAADVMACACRVRMMRKHENYKETGGGAAAHGDH